MHPNISAISLTLSTMVGISDRFENMWNYKFGNKTCNSNFFVAVNLAEKKAANIVLRLKIVRDDAWNSISPG